MNPTFTARSVSVRWLMDEVRAAQIAERLVALREGSKETDQPITGVRMARHCGVSTRVLQDWVSPTKPKGFTYEHALEIAELFKDHPVQERLGVRVDADWLWSGRTASETPDLMGQLSFSDRLERIEQVLEVLAQAVAPDAVARLVAGADLATPQPHSQPAQEQASSDSKSQAAKRQAGSQ